MGIQRDNSAEAAAEELATAVLAMVSHPDAEQLLVHGQMHMAGRRIHQRINENTPNAAKICEISPAMTRSHTTEGQDSN